MVLPCSDLRPGLKNIMAAYDNDRELGTYSLSIMGQDFPINSVLGSSKLPWYLSFEMTLYLIYLPSHK